jgi:acylphosphatase
MRNENLSQTMVTGDGHTAQLHSSSSNLRPYNCRPTVTIARQMSEGFAFEVFGKVQGVFFRKHTQRHADTLGVLGWVRNTRRGTVEGQAVASDNKREQLLKHWLEHVGSPSSRVDRVEFSKLEGRAVEKLKRLDGFEIHQTA